MEKSPINTLLILLSCLLILFDSVCNSNAQVVNCLASDRDALMDFKSGLQDPFNGLSSWRGSNCCQWYGIQCENTTGAVVAIDLHSPFLSESSSRYGIWFLGGEIRPSLMKLKSLRHLDLSSNYAFNISIPEFIGSLENLQYLNLSHAGFSGTIPPILGNLSCLEILDLRGYGMFDENIEWVTGLVSLKYLFMTGVNLSLVKDWVSPLNQLPSIVELHLSGCHLSGHIPTLTSPNFTSLAVIDLSENYFESMIPYWVVNISSLQYINLRFSGLNGRIPLGFGELPNLLFLDLSVNYNLNASCSQLFKGRWEKIQELRLNANKLYGELPSSLGNMTSLMYLDLEYNDIRGGIPSSIGKLYNLTYFSLGGNKMNVSLPEFLEGTESYPYRNPLPNLLHLDLSENQLVGKIPIWLGQLKNMVELSLQYNKLTGIVSEAHFLKLTKLKNLYLSSNSLTVNVSSNWIPPFQVQNLGMGSCILGPSFPAWLKSQKEVIQSLDISNASISAAIPSWFWNISIVNDVDMSHNELQGQLPNPLYPSSQDLDLSFNQLEGPIIIANVVMANITSLVLSHNHFSGPIPQNIGESMPSLHFLSLSHNQLSGEIPTSIGLMSNLRVIDLSSNNFTGRIPSSLANCSTLIALDLMRNSLSEAIPNPLGQLQQLKILHLKNNQLSGNLPPSFANLSNLETIDLANNKLSGEIPAWLGDGFPHLKILKLSSNAFFGEIPFELSKLSSLQILDLGDNDLGGSIPASLGDLKAMVEDERILNKNEVFVLDDGYEENLDLMIKGQSQEYTTTLPLMTSIDLSRNNLSGRLPWELTKLFGLVVLNLSGNHITGSIPGSISHMHQLSSLDLSNNQLFGTIPPNLSSLSFLGYLNLSNNNLTGPIPYIGHTTTFDASSFVGNPGLCGPPLPLSSRCPGDEDHIHGSNKGASNEEKKDGFIDNWFYLSLGLGFAVGILVPYIILAMKRSWSDVYFDFVDTAVYELIVLIRRRINHGHQNKRRPRR